MKRRRLGQHFLKSDDAARRIVDAAGITDQDTVLEIGPGRGELTGHICRRAKKVTAVELDRYLYMCLKGKPNPGNLDLVCGDGFSDDASFDILVSALPYSQSRRAVEWLSRQEFSRAVIMVQQEFADKLTARGRNRRAISVLASWAFDMEALHSVPGDGFEPPPEVDSVVLRVTQRNRATRGMVSAINRLFSHRRKTVRNILKGFGVEYEGSQRLDELTDEEIVRIAETIR